MNITDVGTVMTLGMSSAALFVSIVFALRQLTLQARANNIPAVVELLQDFRSPAFIDDYVFVCEQLSGYEPENGIVGLDADVRVRVYNVCFFFQGLGTLMLMRIIDERIFLAAFRSRIIPVWRSVAPFVAAERLVNPSTGSRGFGILEVLAERAQRLDDGDTESLLAEWRDRPV
jgi:hypothetical protein